MSYIDEVKKAIANQIRAEYPTYTIQQDGEVKSFPSFFVRDKYTDSELMTMTDEDTHLWTFSIRIEYYNSQNPLTDLNLNNVLADVGEKLQEILRYVDVFGKKRFVTFSDNKTENGFRIVDFYFTCVLTYEKELVDPMLTLDAQARIKEE